jgi:hypothetical protein
MHSGYFYDGQVRRFLTQFIRLMSNFYVEFASDAGKTLHRVPVIYGDSSRQAAVILKNNSENYLNSVPAMAAYIAGFRYDRDRVQNPNFISKLHLRQRAIDPSTGALTTQQGDAVSVERSMPVPYTLTIKLDIWTSNTEQKLQLLEQICSIFNPAIEIQSTDNYIDWGSLSYVLLTDTGFTSRSVPVGTQDSLDVSTLTFEVPVWISPPALVKRQGVIHKIIASVYDDHGELNPTLNDAMLFSRQYFTPMDYNIIITNVTTPLPDRVRADLLLVKNSNITFNPLGESVWRRLTANSVNTTNITVSSGDGIESGMVLRYQSESYTVVSVNENQVRLNRNISATADTRVSFHEPVKMQGDYHNWRDLMTLYGNLVSGSTRVKVEIDQGMELVGTVAYNPSNENVLMWEVNSDTIPATTMYDITAIIDPTKSRPNFNMPLPQTGTRYLLTQDYSNEPRDGADAEFNWLGADGYRITAGAGDIIQYNGRYWDVAFDSSRADSVEYVLNQTTNMLYKFRAGVWSKVYEGVFQGGSWQIII